MRRPCSSRSGGFTYVGLLILVAIIGLVAAATVKLGSLLQRRAAEEELLEIGAAFSDALKSYADASTPGQRPQPATLDELLRDPRFPTTRRHLRKLYLDPMTGSVKWGIVRAPDKIGILGVYSLSEAAPIKLDNFEQRFGQFAHKQHISEWKFMAAGSALPPEPPVQGPPVAPPSMPPPAEPVPVPAPVEAAPPPQPAEPAPEAPPPDAPAPDPAAADAASNPASKPDNPALPPVPKKR